MTCRQATPFLLDAQLQESDVGTVVLPDGVLHPDEKLLARERNRDTLELPDLHAPLDRSVVVDPARTAEEVHDDLVGDPDHRVAADVVVGHLGRGVVGKRSEGTLDGPDVLVGRLDEEVDGLRRPDEPVKQDREAADQDVPGALGIQRTAEGDEVLELWRA